VKNFFLGMAFMHFAIKVAHKVNRAHDKRFEPVTKTYKMYQRHIASAPDEVEFITVHDAQVVLESLANIHELHGFVTVHDFYELTNVQTKFLDRTWGWDKLDDVDVTRTTNGFKLTLPRPVPRPA